MATRTLESLAEQIREAGISVAKSAIGSPYVYPEWGRLRGAAQKLGEAQAEYDLALAAWEKLIAPAPPEWKKLAPTIPTP